MLEALGVAAGIACPLFLAVCTVVAIWLAQPNREPDAAHRFRSQRRALTRCHIRVNTHPPHRPLEHHT